MDVQGLAYLVADAADLDAWANFADHLLGVQRVPTEGGMALRLDERAVRILVLRTEADADGATVAGWEVPDQARAEALVQRSGRPAQLGTPTEAAARGVGGFLRLTDPAGQPVELCWAPLLADTAFVGARPHGGFRTGDLGLGHVVWSMADLDPAMAFYRDILGFRPSDYATVPGRMFFFHTNPRHHCLALGQLGFSGLHHLMIEVVDFDDLGRAYDAALESDWPIITKLGRHSNDHVTSFYVRTPSGWAIEVGWGGLLIVDEDSWQVRELVEGPSLWGHERSWVSPEMQVKQRTLRHEAAKQNLRAPLHVAAGAALDIEGIPVAGG